MCYSIGFSGIENFSGFLCISFCFKIHIPVIGMNLACQFVSIESKYRRNAIPIYDCNKRYFTILYCYFVDRNLTTSSCRTKLVSDSPVYNKFVTFQYVKQV